MDNYFKTLDPKTAPRTADGLVDFESPKCMDMDLLNSHFAKLSKGRPLWCPSLSLPARCAMITWGLLSA